MTLDPSDAVLQEARARLSPYGRETLERAAALALRIHSDHVGPEHLVHTLLGDEDSAAHRVVLHAFADPETLADEVLALAEGILVVGSARARPFSAGAVQALGAARGDAAAAAAGAVEPAHLLLHAFDRLEAGLGDVLVAAGFERARAADAAAELGGRGPVEDSGPLFRSFSTPAKQALSRGAHQAAREEIEAVSPGCVLLACLEVEPALEGTAGLPLHRARMALAGKLGDPGAPADRVLEADEPLRTLLGRLAAGSGTLEILLACHGDPARELAQLLGRHRITPPLLERSQGVFRDPGDPPAGSFERS